MAVAGNEPHAGDRSSLPFGRIVGNRTSGLASVSSSVPERRREPLWREAFEYRRIRTTSGERLCSRKIASTADGVELSGSTATNALSRHLHRFSRNVRLTRAGGRHTVFGRSAFEIGSVRQIIRIETPV